LKSDLSLLTFLSKQIYEFKFKIGPPQYIYNQKDIMIHQKQSNLGRTILFTAFALTAFAANSVLNRLALGGNTIDASSYIGIRLVSGAAVLWLLNGLSKRSFRLAPKPYFEHFRPRLMPAFFLFAYGIAFSFAYRSLSSGMGAFILFGTVQTTMLTIAVLKGERPHISEWLGLVVAFSGLVYLVFPGLAAPDPLGAVLMLVAGIAWGFYTLSGRGVKDPLETTSLNFLCAVPMVLVINLFTMRQAHISTEGVVFACISGAVTSGMGYAIWFTALKGLSTTQAALFQLLVPIIAAWGGVVFLSENITSRLVWAGVLIITGVVLALLKFGFSADKSATN
jgi:drug/metabolite transporter (DMT)-like permease